VSTLKRHEQVIGTEGGSTNTKPVMRKGVTTTRHHLTVSLCRRLGRLGVVLVGVVSGRCRSPLKKGATTPRREVVSLGRATPPKVSAKKPPFDRFAFSAFYPLRPCEVACRIRIQGRAKGAWSRSEINLMPEFLLLLFLHMVSYTVVPDGKKT
jgi:hypothetical protein